MAERHFQVKGIDKAEVLDAAELALRGIRLRGHHLSHLRITGTTAQVRVNKRWGTVRTLAALAVSVFSITLIDLKPWAGVVRVTVRRGNKPDWVAVTIQAPRNDLLSQAELGVDAELGVVPIPGP